jgi:tetratricopeptide (TPR) repeat protein
VAAFLTVSLFRTGADGAAESAQRALAIGAALGDFGLQVTARYYLSLAYHQLGDYVRAIECLRTNLDVLKGDLSRERFGMPGFPALASRGRLIHSLADVGEFAEASRLADEAVWMADAADEVFTRALIYSAVGELCLARGRFSGAISALEKSLVLCETVPIFFSWTAACLGIARAHAGDIVGALPLLEEAVARPGRVDRGDPLSVHVIARLGEGCLLAGRVDEAGRWAEKTLALARELKQRGAEASALRLLGDIASRRDSPEQADGHYRDALALAQELGMRPLVAHCHLGLAKLSRRTGNDQQAQAHLTTAITMYREMDMRFWLEQAEAIMRALA